MTVKEIIDVLSKQDPNSEAIYLDSYGNYSRIQSVGIVKDGKLVKVSEKDGQVNEC